MNMWSKTVGGFIAHTGLVLALLVTGWLLQTPSVQAAGPTCTVGTSGADYTTIQAAVNDYNCGTINVAAGTYTENVSISRIVTINGADTGSTIVDGNYRGSVFSLNWPAQAITLNRLTIQHGSAEQGGGIWANGPALTLLNSTIRDNQASSAGGGIASLISDLTIANSTLANNSDAFDVTGANAVVIASTIANNNGPDGQVLADYGSTVTFRNTIIAGGCYTNPYSGTIVDGGHNLALSDSCKVATATDLKLDPNGLQNNGGSTPTIALLSGSPAIDAGDDAVCSAAPVGGVDQRGVARPIGIHCDIGAYEATATEAPIVTVRFPAPTGQNGWFTSGPVVGSVTVQALARITGVNCGGAVLSNLMLSSPYQATGTLTVNGDGISTASCLASDVDGHYGVGTGSQASVDVKIDSVAPETTITAQPANPSGGTATFSFTGSDATSGVASYQCQLDSGSFTPCTSPVTYNGLSTGAHTFQVQSIDQAGLIDATPVSYPWTVSAPPSANDDSYAVNQGTPLLIAAPGLLSNDSDVAGNALSASLVSNPANGSVTLNANGAFSYLPKNGFVGTDSFTYQASDGQATSNVATVSITVNADTGSPSPVGITGGSAVEVIDAPCSVAPNVLENDSLMRIFPERLAYRLPSAVTVTAPNGSTQTIAQGTLVDSYYLHADWVNGGQNVAKLFKGNVSFSQPALGVITSGNGLLATNAMLGTPGTTYTTTTDQGLEGYDDNAWFSDGGRTLHLWLNVYNTSDAVRILTPARPGLTLAGAVEGIGSPCSVAEGKLENDSAIRFFAERLNDVLPASITVAGYGADGVGTPGMVLPQGSHVNVYYVHADLVGDGQGKQLSGSVTFAAPILAVLVDGAPLKNTHNTLGATWHPTIKTAYSARDDQGLESGDQISVAQNRVDFTLSGNADTDQIRIITAAPGGSTTVSAATATDNASDDSLALPADAVHLPLDGDAGAVVAPLDNNVDTTTVQFTDHIYLPLVSR